MTNQTSAEIMAGWPEAARESAGLVVKAYGEPHEMTDTALTWNHVGDWKRIVAQRAFWQHDFPAPHTDSVESFLDYRVPPASFTPLAEFDGSVMVERTSGEVSARCHDEEANRLALNLMHDLVTGSKTVAQARDYYSKEFLAARESGPTPYMDALTFEPGTGAGDPDVRTLSEARLEQAKADSPVA